MLYNKIFKEDIPVDLAPSSAGNVNILYNSETAGKGDYIHSYPPSKTIDKSVLDEICAKIAKKAELKSLQPSNKLSSILNKSFKDVAVNNQIELTIVTNEKGVQLLSLLGDKGGKKESYKPYPRLFEAFVAKRSSKSIKLSGGLPVDITVYGLRDNDEAGEDLSINDLYLKISEKFPKNLYFSANYRDSLYSKKDDIPFTLQSFKAAIKEVRYGGDAPHTINTAAMNAEVEIYQMLKLSDPKTSPVPVDKYVFLLSKLKDLLDENDRMHQEKKKPEQNDEIAVKRSPTSFSGQKFRKSLGKSL